jgi:hypothetical protein
MDLARVILIVDEEDGRHLSVEKEKAIEVPKKIGIAAKEKRAGKIKIVD